MAYKRIAGAPTSYLGVRRLPPLTSLCKKQGKLAKDLKDFLRTDPFRDEY